MTTENKLTILVIIAELIGPILAVLIAAYITWRLSQPKATSELSQQKDRIQIISDRIMRLALCISLFAIALDSYLLFQEFHNTAPVTRGAILRISALIGGIVWNAVNMSLLCIWRSIVSQSRIDTAHSEGLKALSEAIRTQSAALDAYSKVTFKQSEDMKTIAETSQLTNAALTAVMEIQRLQTESEQKPGKVLSVIRNLLRR